MALNRLPQRINGWRFQTQRFQRFSQSSKLGEGSPGMEYPPSSHFPRSASWQRGEQNGNDLHSLLGGKSFSQMGQGLVCSFDAIGILLSGRLVLALEFVVAALLDEVGSANPKLLRQLALIPMRTNQALVDYLRLNPLDELSQGRALSNICG